MTKVVIYHNPRCSKSRETLKLLEQHELAPQVIQYLETPPTREELAHILKLLHLPARELIRSGEAEYKALGLDDPALSDEALIDAMVSHPKLIQRPIVISGRKAAIGRPPERVLDIL